MNTDGRVWIRCTSCNQRISVLRYFPDTIHRVKRDNLADELLRFIEEHTATHLPTIHNEYPSSLFVFESD